MADADPIDVLVHVAWNQPLATRVERARRVDFVSVERAVRKLRQPLLMIHGGADQYITPEMAERLFGEANKSAAKELWVVPGAKHNQALAAAGDEYTRKVVAFFDRHLAAARRPAPAADPMTETAPAAEVAAAVAEVPGK